jgi:AraC-like DNA-binding protein
MGRLNKGIRVDSHHPDRYPLGPPIVENIAGVWEFRLPVKLRNRWASLPGHVIHLVTAGNYRLSIENHFYEIGPGDVVWFQEAEDTEWWCGEKETVFYSVHFMAGKLTPPPLDQRRVASTSRLREAYRKLHDASHMPVGPARDCRLYAELLVIIGELLRDESVGSQRPVSLWEKIERRVRKEKRFDARMPDLEALSGASASSIARDCRAVTGASPMRRIREIRVEEAKGLLLHSSMNVTEIAASLNYGRIHEFSREFSNVQGVSPTAYRKSRPTFVRATPS